MKRLLAALTAAGITTAMVPAQVVSPKEGKTQGNGSNAIPYSWEPIRYQQIHDPDSFDLAQRQIVRSINYRVALDKTTGPVSVTLTILIGLAPQGRNSGNFSMTFDQNIDKATLKTFVNRRTIKFAYATSPTFNVKIPSDSGVAFVWPGTAGGRALVVETRVYGNTNRNQHFGMFLDTSWSLPAGGGKVTANGNYGGCPAKNGSRVTHREFPMFLFIGNTNHVVQGFAQGNKLPGAAIIGAAPLRVTLPGTTCMLMNDLLLLLPGVSDSTNSGGVTNIPLPFVNDAGLVGVRYYSQMFWLQQGANALGITTTNSLLNEIGRPAPFRASRLWNYSTSKPIDPDKVPTANGSTFGLGLVTQFSL